MDICITCEIKRFIKTPNNKKVFNEKEWQLFTLKNSNVHVTVVVENTEFVKMCFTIKCFFAISEINGESFRYFLPFLRVHRLASFSDHTRLATTIIENIFPVYQLSMSCYHVIFIVQFTFGCYKLVKKFFTVKTVYK